MNHQQAAHLETGRHPSGGPADSHSRADLAGRPSCIGRCLATALTFLLAGCGPSDRASDGTPAGQAPDAATVLLETIEQYQQAAHYHDRGRLQLTYEVNGQRTSEDTQIDVDFSRPNRFRLHIARGANRLRMVSDGSHLWTDIDDPATANLRNQVVRRPAPRRPTVSEIYATTEMIDPANPNQMMSVLMGLPLNLHTSQLGLLLPDSALVDLIGRAKAVTSLTPEAIEGATCDRIEVTDAVGRYVFWIDSQQKRVRRIEYPTHELFRLVSDAQRPTDVHLTLDLHEVSFDRRADTTFAFQTDSQAQVVQYFVLPPSPLPSDRFGQAVPEMTFTDLAGEADSNQGRDEKIQVLIWFDDHPESQFNLSRLAAVYQRFADQQDRIVFRAICVVPTEQLSDEGVKQLAIRWKSPVPLVRDVNAMGRDALGVSEAPTIVVLDETLRLHLFEIGANPQIDQSVQVVVQRLLSGENVADDVLKNWKLRDEQFQVQLRRATVNRAETQVVETPSISAAKGFEKLTATVAWQIDTIDAPGNLLLIPSTESTPSSLLVLDGMQYVVEVNADGQVAERHALELDEAAFVGQLRYAVDGQGKEFILGFTQLGRHVFLFDRQFQQILEYPASEQKHNGIMDAELLDLDEDGTLELYVGFADPHGCQRVDLRGQRIWSNRTLPATLSLAGHSLARPTQLLTTGENGWILPIRANGQQGERVMVGTRTIHQIVASPSREPRPTHFLGMSYSMEGRLVAVGLDTQLSEQWSYGLPGGVFRHQVRSPIWSPILGGCWLLAGPEGSVHLVGDDGSYFDHFSTGHDILGLAGSAGDEGERLYVVTSGTLTAYDLKRAVGKVQETDELP